MPIMSFGVVGQVNGPVDDSFNGVGGDPPTGMGIFWQGNWTAQCNIQEN